MKEARGNKFNRISVTIQGEKTDRRVGVGITRGQITMVLSKKRKVDSENRAFKTEWTDTYMLILHSASTKPACLICSETVALIKSGNVKHHYETKHNAFEQSYPLKSELRSQKISSLRAQYDQSTILTHSFTAQQCADECSLRVAWILGQHKKSLYRWCCQGVHECSS